MIGGVGEGGQLMETPPRPPANDFFSNPPSSYYSVSQPQLFSGTGTPHNR